MRSSISLSLASTVLTLAAMNAGCDTSAAPLPAPEPEGEPEPEVPTTTAAPLAPSASVFVNNSTSQPVPTRAVGSTTVDGTVKALQSGTWNVGVTGGTVGASQAGTWSVGATQAGAWSMGVTSLPPVALAPGSSVSVGAVGSLPPVTIAGTPAVQVVNTPAVTIANSPHVAVSGTVAIANSDDDEAVPVRIVGGGGGDSGDGGPGPAAPTAMPWVLDGQVVIPIGESYATRQLFAPPPGKRVVVESLSIDGQVPAGQTLYQARILASSNGEGASFRFPLQPVPDDFPSHDSFATVQNIKLNISGGVIVTALRTGTTGAAVVNVALSGYLVDVN